jgi:hypothetical protein
MGAASTFSASGVLRRVTTSTAASQCKCAAAGTIARAAKLLGIGHTSLGEWFARRCRKQA